MKWSTLMSKCILLLTSALAVWRIHQSSHNWIFYVLKGSPFSHRSPVFAVFGFIVVFIASTLSVFLTSLEGYYSVQSFHDSAVKVSATTSLCFIGIHFCYIYEYYYLGWFHLLMLMIVALSVCVLPVAYAGILNVSLQLVAVMTIILLSFSHQNWHGVLGAQLLVLNVVSIGTKGTLFNFPSIDGFHYMLACATFLLSQAVIFAEF